MNWTLEVGVEKRDDVPFYVKAELMRKEKFHQKTHKEYTFYQPSVSMFYRFKKVSRCWN